MEVVDWIEWENGGAIDSQEHHGGCKIVVGVVCVWAAERTHGVFFDQQEWLKQRFRQKKWVFDSFWSLQDMILTQNKLDIGD